MAQAHLAVPRLDRIGSLGSTALVEAMGFWWASERARGSYRRN